MWAWLARSAGLAGLKDQMKPLRSLIMNLVPSSRSAAGASAGTPAPSSRSSLRDLLAAAVGPDRDAPIVSVLSPGDAAEDLQAGETVLIRWNSSDNVAVTSQRVQVSLDDGRTYSDVSPELPGDADRFEWRVPRTATRHGRIKLIAFDAAGNCGFASSPRPFAIRVRPASRPAVRLLAPRGLQLLRGGFPVVLTWKPEHVDHMDPASLRYDVLVSLNGQDYEPLARDLPGAQQRLRWTVPAREAHHVRLRVVVRVGSQVLAQDTSSEPLTITTARPQRRRSSARFRVAG